MSSVINKFSKEKLFGMLKDAFNKESAYWTRRKVYPDTDDLVTSSERDEMVSYMLELCDREYMAFGIETFALATTLLDRFLASFKVKSKFLECLAISCLFISCKVKEEDDNVTTAFQFLYDCESSCTLGELMRMELMVLSKFDWSVDDITCVDFFHLFYAILVNYFDSSSSSATVIDELDFLASAEHMLKQCLCINELTSVYRPHELAFALLSIQIDRRAQASHIANDDSMSSHQYNEIRLFNFNRIAEVLGELQVFIKMANETLDKCKEHMRVHVAQLESTRSMYEQYFQMTLSRRSNRTPPQPVYVSSSVASAASNFIVSMPTSLSIIHEEEEEDDQGELENTEIENDVEENQMDLDDDEEDDYDVCVTSKRTHAVKATNRNDEIARNPFKKRATMDTSMDHASSSYQHL